MTIRVTDVELPGKGNDYDADHNETIDLDEAIAAVADYYGGGITKDEAIAIINLYFIRLTRRAGRVESGVEKGREL